MAAPELPNEGRPTWTGFPRGVSPSGFSHAVTIALSFVLVSFMLSLATPSHELAPHLLLKKPVETAIRVFERDLETEEVLARLSGLERSLLTIVAGRSDARNEAIDAFEALLDQKPVGGSTIGGWRLEATPEELDRLRARHAVLLAEAGRIDEARSDLEQLARAGHETFPDALRVAYARSTPDDARPFSAYDVGAAGDEWIGKHLQLRLAEMTRDTAAVERITREIAESSAGRAARIRRLALLFLVPLGLGTVLLLGWLARNRPVTIQAGATIPPVWTIENGYAVFVRAVFYALLAGLVLGGLDLVLDTRLLTPWSTLLASIPVWILVRKRLLAFNGIPLGATFGLSGLRRPFAWIAFTLGVWALDILGSQALTTLLHRVGLASNWAENVLEDQIWSPRSAAILEGIDTCVWAPFIEEFVCRGLLYLTLRRLYSPLGAALLSAAIFGAVHPYSLPGLVSVTWSGFVWALAVERSRSLWPGTACHAASNAFVVASTWILLR